MWPYRPVCVGPGLIPRKIPHDTAHLPHDVAHTMYDASLPWHFGGNMKTSDCAIIHNL